MFMPGSSILVCKYEDFGVVAKDSGFVAHSGVMFCYQAHWAMQCSSIPQYAGSERHAL